ncbi:hypothetical protein BJF85_24750 [Saccharomonospora sp. CUA-673]|uniref:hypothetical protein n=1 Tax=Saccharomonospora sp. CUA-673 TaxID=1904969 RepID=UPI0009612227|nr:hypothetical protein [Saccharomonospora sp. CUA-673]OLT41133.1 hypothetical protein BJF85_24750 [Saccharomonospora sp. CUA-673]
MTVELDAQQPIRPDYRGTFGWPVEQYAGGFRLITGSGVAAVVVPRALSDAVLTDLRKLDCLGPALGLPTRRERVTVLLAEADDLGAAHHEPPEGIRVLPAGSIVPLPDGRAECAAQWLVEPDAIRRWLPSLGAVLAAVASMPTIRNSRGARTADRRDIPRELLTW